MRLTDIIKRKFNSEQLLIIAIFLMLAIFLLASFILFKISILEESLGTLDKKLIELSNKQDGSRSAIESLPYRIQKY